MVYSVRGRGKHISRMRRHQRMRKRVFGSAEKSHLIVIRSNHHMIVQLVGDYIGKTLTSASTTEDTLRVSSDKKVDRAREVGKLVAQYAKAADTAAVILDRGSSKYHSRAVVVVGSAREGGLSL